MHVCTNGLENDSRAQGAYSQVKPTGVLALFLGYKSKVEFFSSSAGIPVGLHPEYAPWVQERAGFLFACQGKKVKVFPLFYYGCFALRGSVMYVKKIHLSVQIIIQCACV